MTPGRFGPGSRRDESWKTTIFLMTTVDLDQLQKLLPKAAAWAEQQEACILAAGVALIASQVADARQLGVVHPERVRLLAVRSIPLPDDPELREAALATQLITPATIGLTLRYGIFFRADYHGDCRLIAHELAHTAQYERLGGMRSFLSTYLRECLTPPGYPHGALEQEAISSSARLGV